MIIFVFIFVVCVLVPSYASYGANPPSITAAYRSQYRSMPTPQDQENGIYSNDIVDFNGTKKRTDDSDFEVHRIPGSEHLRTLLDYRETESEFSAGMARQLDLLYGGERQERRRPKQRL